MIDRSEFESELTFVVQGPNLDRPEVKITSNLIESIHKFFPASPIIFSTWYGEEIEFLPYVDKIVYSSDPGASVFLENPRTLNNVNRQIVSTVSGLRKVKTRYAAKVRSDLIFTNNKILASLDNLNLGNRNSDYAFLNSCVLVSNQTSVNPRLNYKYPYSICDWISIGTTEDLREMWDIPLMPNSWFQYFKDTDKTSIPPSTYLSRYFPETYIVSSFTRKHIPIIFDNSYDISNNNIEISEQVVSNNFIIFSNWQLGIKSQKHNKKLRTLLPMYTFTSWKRISQQHGVHVDIFKIDFLDFILKVTRSLSFIFIIEGKLKFEWAKIFKDR